MHITGQIHVDKAGPAPCRMEFRKGRTEKEGGEITDRIQMKRMVVGSRMGAWSQAPGQKMMTAVTGRRQLCAQQQIRSEILGLSGLPSSRLVLSRPQAHRLAPPIGKVWSPQLS